MGWNSGPGGWDKRGEIALPLDQQVDYPYVQWDFILALPTLTSFFVTQFFFIMPKFFFVFSLFISFFFFLFLFLSFSYLHWMIPNFISQPHPQFLRLTYVGVFCQGRGVSMGAHRRGRPRGTSPPARSLQRCEACLDEAR